MSFDEEPLYFNSDSNSRLLFPFQLEQSQPFLPISPPREPQDESNESNKRMPEKQHPIQKPNKKKRKELQSKMGRPNNQDFQNKHLEESKSYNDIIYHYSKLLIFLKLKNLKEQSSVQANLSLHQKMLIQKEAFIMNIENFPSENEEKRPTFLLHPCSLHFLLRYHKEVDLKHQYNSDELKFMFMAFLQQKKLLTSTIYDYVNQYWLDILYLVEHPDGEDSEFYLEPQNNEVKESVKPFKEEKEKESQLLASSEAIKNSSSSNRINNDTGKQPKDNSQKQCSELKRLKEQLEEDDSIAAYQIACYLHACQEKFDFRIVSFL